MIRITNLSFSRGGRTLLANISLTLPPRARIGIVGANGAGKSSFFACVKGDLSPDTGEIEIPGGWTMAHVAQENPNDTCSAIEYALRGDAELIALEAEIEALAMETTDAAGNRLAEVYAQLDLIGGHSARARAAELLAGLGFSEERQQKAVNTFSGGWRMRLNLAQALMTRSDLLLLDEPTNHLDIEAVMWLEGWLQRYPGMLLVITHDRDFLDAIAQHILHLEGNGAAVLYTGNYSGFEVQRGERLTLQQAAFEKQQRSIKHLESFITRFRAKATKARQAQSRIKTLEKMERIAAAHTDSPFTFAFRPALGQPRQLISFEHADIGYNEKPLLRNVGLSVLPTSKIGLLGRNGEGKSTLIKAIAGHLQLLGGQRHVGQHLKVGYFAQHQLETLRPQETALWHLMQCDQAEAENFGKAISREQELRDFLGSFDFRGNRLADPVGVFSGGEKARLALAIIVWQRPNLLLLDEPTNHLDMEMRHSLTEALLDYEGALIVVAHDRHLMRATCDELVWVHGGKVEAFEGDLDDYREALKLATTVPSQETAAERKDRRADRREEAEERRRIAQLKKPLASRLAAIESQLTQAQAERAPVAAWLAGEEAYTEAARTRLADSLKREGELATRIAELETEWLALTEQLEWVR